MILRKVLCVAIIAELVLTGWFAIERAKRPAAPRVNYGKLDDDSAEQLEELSQLAEESSDTTAWRTVGEAFLGNGYYAAAEQCFRRASEIDPSDVQSLYARAFCLERVGRAESAIGTLRETAEVADPELGRTCWYQIGRNHLRLDNVEDAEAAFRRIGDFTPAAYQLAKLMIRSGRAAEAVPILERTLQEVPNSLKLIQLRARAADVVGDTQTAAEFYDRETRAEYSLVLEYGTSFLGMFGARYGLGRRLSETYRLKDEGTLVQRRFALENAVATIRRHSFWNYRSVFVALAQVQLGMQEPDEALRTLDEIARKTTRGPDILEFEGDAFLMKGLTDKARGAWQQAVRLGPSAELHDKLASIAVDDNLKRHHLAQAAFLRGLIEFRVNRIETAVAEFTDADKLEPTNEHFLFYLAEANRVAGQTQQAITLYQRCLAVNPNHSRAIRQLEALETPANAASDTQ